MNILLLGAKGQLGRELQSSMASAGDLIALDRSGGAGGLCGDLEDLRGISDTVSDLKPDIIINAAAYTKVDQAEEDKDLAYIVNSQAPVVLAREAKKIDALLVHYSTDYVFDGSGDKPWREDDPTQPLNVYGASKLEGEQNIISSGCSYLIFRTSWVYSSHGDNFAKKMISLAMQRDELKVINDQIGAPTGAKLLADCTAKVIPHVLADYELGGLYHLSASGEASWYEYACFVLDQARSFGINLKVTPESVIPVSSDSFPTPAKRPHNSRLDCSKFSKVFGIELPNWKVGVSEMLDSYLPVISGASS